MTFVLSRDAARIAMVAAQGLDRRPRRKARPDDLLETIRRMGALQIDSIHVVARSPYLVLWSRLGAYAPEWLDKHLANGRIFEYWAHEACFLPIEDYALHRHRMEAPEQLGWKYRAEWVAENAALMEAVLEDIRTRGPLRAADFETPARRGPWWGWKPAKRALEMLFSEGRLMIARRERFQRVYDLRERVHPNWNHATPPGRDAALRALAAKAVRALGVARTGWVADYFRTPKKPTVAAVHALAKAGTLRPVEVDAWGEAWIHEDNVALAERAASGELKPSLTTLLSPFDPLVWDRARALQVFDFDYRIECYTPAPKRKYGYFVLPILRRGKLVGRLDAKAHRRRGDLEVLSLHLEAATRPSSSLANDIARVLRDFAAWQELYEVRIRKVVPGSFRRELLSALSAR